MPRQAQIITDQRARAAFKEAEGNPRETLILTLSLKAGLRAKEIAMLDWADIDFADRVLRLKRTKGDKPRNVDMHKDLEAALIAYKAARGNKAVGRVLVNTHNRPGEPLTADAVRCWLKDFFARRCGWQDGFTSHSGRRTFITKVARKISAAGGSMADVQALAGHSSFNTTRLYIATDPEAQRRVIDLI